MGNVERVREFLKYMREPLSEDKIIQLYKENNISFEKCNLYSDFIETMINYIFNTYLGDDFMNIVDQKIHFNWCFNKTISGFKNEKIIFNENEILNEYFWEFFEEAFYKEKEKKQKLELHKKVMDFWLLILDHKKNKTLSDMDNLIEVYSIFEDTLKT